MLEHPDVEEGETVGNMEDINTANLKLSEVSDVIVGCHSMVTS